MNELQSFTSEEFGSIRTLTIEGEPWFVGKDVAAALGYAKPENAIAAHVDDEDKTSTLIQGSGSNYKSNTIIINESGLYSLILSSKLPSAKHFKRWVTAEVLPSIRKTGKYTPASEVFVDRPLTRDDYIRAADIVAHCRNSRLPLAMALLRKAGMDVPEVAERVQQTEEQQNMERLREVLSRYGIREAAALTNLAPAVISRYAHGKSNPRPDRYQMIIQILE